MPSQDGSQTPGSCPASVSLSLGQPAVLAALTIIVALGAAAFVLHAQGHAALSLSVVFGAVFGVGALACVVGVVLTVPMIGRPSFLAYLRAGPKLDDADVDAINARSRDSGRNVNL